MAMVFKCLNTKSIKIKIEMRVDNFENDLTVRHLRRFPIFPAVVGVHFNYTSFWNGLRLGFLFTHIGSHLEWEINAINQLICMKKAEACVLLLLCFFSGSHPDVKMFRRNSAGKSVLWKLVTHSRTSVRSLSVGLFWSHHNNIVREVVYFTGRNHHHHRLFK